MNVIGLSDYAGFTNTGLHCWLCQKGASARALFCHHCGTIQPVREIDHFARLGLERRLEIDSEHLEHQYAALSRTLDPQRFLIRGIGERGYAAKQLEALKLAYETLSEPLSRGRYWLSLHGQGCSASTDVHPFVHELRSDLASAAEPSHCDRVAHKAGQAMENGIMGLMQALRGQDWQRATNQLLELDGLEHLLGAVRTKRAELAPTTERAG